MKNKVVAFTSRYPKIVNRLISPVSIISNDEEMRTQFAQWDTGATCTCISQAVIDRLDLKPISQTFVRTPSGDRVLDVYLVDIKLPNNLLVENVTAIGSEIGAQGIDVLIGMDIISHGDFAVSNFEGITQFTFRSPSQEHADYIKKKQDA